MRMFALAPEQIGHTWDDYSNLIDEFATRTGTMKPSALKEAAEEGLVQIWGLQDEDGVHGVVVTEIVDEVSGKVCDIKGAVSDGSPPAGIQKRLLDEIGRWASAQECRAVRLQGRKGWLRRFPLFKQTGVVAEWKLRTEH